MSEQAIRVLLVEDDDDDYFLVQDYFHELGAKHYVLDRVPTFDEAVLAFHECKHDLILLDYRLGSHNGLDLIGEAKRLGCVSPIIMLTGQDDPDVDRQALTAGASDYLVKDQLNAKLLDRSIRYALRQRRLEEEIRQANEQLEQRVAARTAELARLNATLLQEIAVRKEVEGALMEADHRKDEFLALLAHELRNPLAPLVTGLEVMHDLTGSSPEEEELRLVMARQVQQLVRLVDDLLDVSRISRGKLQVQRERISIHEVVAGAVDLCRPAMDAARHRFLSQLPSQELFVLGDRVRLMQVVGNLLINAAKYTPSQGEIELLVAPREGEVAIVVRDTGIGIPAEMLPRIFELFIQVDTDLQRAHGGLGIGLTLAKQLVEMHGGRIEVSSAGAGKGSEFSVFIPLSEELHQNVPALESLTTIPEFRVLIVDDNQPAAFLLHRLLQRLGQQVTVYESPLAAFAAVPNFKPQVVISDIAMPEMSGYALARQLRLLNLEPRPTLVALTGYGQDRDRAAAYEAGFDFHLTKPVSLVELQKLFVSIATNFGST